MELNWWENVNPVENEIVSEPFFDPFLKFLNTKQFPAILVTFHVI